MNTMEEMVMVVQANMFFVTRMFVGLFQGQTRAYFDESVQGMMNGYRSQTAAWISQKVDAMKKNKVKQRDIDGYRLQAKQALDIVAEQFEQTLKGLSIGVVIEPNTAGTEECKIPPPGWRCTRPANHPGPCAAIPAADPLKPEQEQKPIGEIPCTSSSSAKSEGDTTL